MKSSYLVLSSIFFSFGLTAQESDIDKKTNRKDNKIETIKIINGDTVLHDIRIVKGDMKMANHIKRIETEEAITDNELSDEIENMIRDIDMYVIVDNDHKNRMVKKMRMSDEDIEDMMREFDIDDDVLIDLTDRNEGMKIIKIQIDEDKGKEVKVIKQEIREKNNGLNNRKERVHSASGSQVLNVYPNPASNQLNLEFEVLEDMPAKLSVVDSNGNKIFEKTYKESGHQKEVIEVKKESKGFYIVSIEDKTRSVTKKIIIE